MPDKKLTDVTDNNVGKMTDNEIIKALEWLESKTKEYCEQCAYKNSEVCDICIFDKIKLALDLINRLQEENERLKRKIEDLESVQEISPEAKYLVDTKADKVISLLTELNKSQEQIKAEAYKEFEEKAEKEIKGWQDDIHINEYDYQKYDFVFERIYEILKEMVKE